ncbi:gag protein [Artemisia annua]|uniref:Gag protein n=1 Tax=Artemisia annua TaxID=35608 RepID=A0A2U1KVY0_ARTAN|nr:gag protein [Artemisia annua]
MSSLEKNTHPFAYSQGNYCNRFEIPIPLNITYDGTTDPDDHLFAFTKAMGICYLTQSQWCKLFPITLRGTARMWFMALQSRSITTFDQLAKSFRTTFLHKVKFQKSRDEIMHMERQDIRESLKEFVERFSDEILATETSERLKGDFEKLAVSVFINGLRPGPCLNDFEARPPTTLEDLLVRANQFRA